MNRLLNVVAVGLLAVPALASPKILPVKDINRATYNLATGELTPMSGGERYGDPVWSATLLSGYYFSTYDSGWTLLDWGDIAGPQDIGGFAFAYGTHIAMPSTIDAVITFYADENGWNSAGRTFLARFVIADLPTSPEGQGAAWIITVDLDGTGDEFTIDGSDLDSDGLADFGYTYWFHNVPDPSDQLGPLVVAEPNEVPSPAPGVEAGFDAFSDPNLTPGSYVATWWFG